MEGEAEGRQEGIGIRDGGDIRGGNVGRICLRRKEGRKGVERGEETRRKERSGWRKLNFIIL